VPMGPLTHCLEGIDDIEQQLVANGVSVERQTGAVYSRDMRTAREIVTKHFPIEWRADARAPDIMVKMAQAIADAVQTARRDTCGMGRDGLTVIGSETLD
jgi:hypothetical protein